MVNWLKKLVSGAAGVLARAAHMPLSQHEIRTILSGMAEKGWVRVSRGRGGSQLTPKGRELWENRQRDSVTI